MVDEISSSAGTANFLNQSLSQTQNMDDSVFDAARQQNIVQRQQQLERMEMLTQIETSPRERTEPRLDAGEIIDFSRDFRDTFSRLQDAAASFTEGSPVETTVLDQRTVEVSNPEAVTGEAEAGADVQEFDLEVSGLAEAQEMESRALPADNPEAISEGEFEFTVEQGDIDETITLEVGEEDNPLEVFQTAAEEIEGTSADLEADVFLTGEDEVFMEVRASGPGEAGEFELRDVEGEFITEELEMTEEQEAMEADVDIGGLDEGDDFEIEGNTVELQDGDVELEIEDTGEIEVEIAPDTEAAEEAVEDLMEAIDDVQEFIADQPAGAALEDMGAGLEAAVDEREEEMAQLGVEIGPEGEIQINEDRFRTAIAEDRDMIEEVFGGPDERDGLAVEADITAERALTRPITEFMEAEAEDVNTEEQEMLPGEEFQVYNRSGQIDSMITMDQGELINIVI